MKIPRNPFIRLTIVAVFAITGLLLLNLTSASTFIAHSEAESGARSSAAASLVANPQASGGSAVRFGDLSTPPPPEPGNSLLVPAATFTKHANLRYSDASQRLLLDLYTPNHNGPLPLIVFIHGGSWVSGSKDECLAAKDLGNGTFMNRGYAVACINYRLSGEAIYPAQIIDVKASIRWLRANATTYKLFTPKIAVWGSSAGGHLAALAGTTKGMQQYEVGANLQLSSQTAAIVDYFGPTDLENTEQNQVDPKGYANVLKLLGGDGPDLDERARAASPVTYVTPDDSPFLIMHGTADRIVPYSQSVLLDQKLREAGVSTQLTTIQGAGHGSPEFVTPARLDAVSKFFDSHIR